jgi:prepilin-type N-terminal cleavage/methylation domain-containing protein
VKKGFTLIEILIVVAIIGIMSAIVLAYMDGARAKGRDARRIAEIKQIEQALEVYFDSCSRYPTPDPVGGPLVGGSLYSNRIPTSLQIDCSGNKILNSLPVDPQNNGTYYYRYYVTSSPVRYHVCAQLELGYAGGAGKSGAPVMTNPDPNHPADTCNGTLNEIFDRYGP